ARHDGNAVRHALVAAELDRHRTVRVRSGGDVVYGVGVAGVLFEVAVLVVDTDRPEAVHRHVLDRQPVYRLAVVLLRLGARVEGGVRRVPAPAGGRADQVLDRIDVALAAEHPRRVDPAVGGRQG